MAAERDFLESKFKRSTSRLQELVGHIQVLRRQLLGAGLHPEVAAVRVQAPDDASVASDDTADASDLDAYRYDHIASSWNPVIDDVTSVRGVSLVSCVWIATGQGRQGRAGIRRAELYQAWARYEHAVVIEFQLSRYWMRSSSTANLTCSKQSKAGNQILIKACH